LATALSCLAAAYFLLLSLRSFEVATTAERLQLALIVLARVVISALNEAVHSARRRAEVASSKRLQTEASLFAADALQRAIFNSATFSSIATDTLGVIQIFNVGA
jgi:hypothetical protein